MAGVVVCLPVAGARQVVVLAGLVVAKITRAPVEPYYTVTLVSCFHEGQSYSEVYSGTLS